MAEGSASCGAVLLVRELSENALDASTVFYTEWLAEAEAILADDADILTIILPEAPYDHRDWRRALARDLARRYTPKRVNCLAGLNGALLDNALNYLFSAAGVTGQYFEVDG